MENPRCRYCGKKIAKKVHYIHTDSAQDPTEHDGKKVLKITRRRYSNFTLGPKKFVYGVWTGDYGRYSKFFCSLSCGHHWAVRFFEKLNKENMKVAQAAFTADRLGISIDAVRRENA